MFIVADNFFLAMVFNPICFAQGGKGKGKGKVKAKAPTHEELIAMYDRNDDGEVSMDEFLEGPKGPSPGGKKGPRPSK